MGGTVVAARTMVKRQSQPMEKKSETSSELSEAPSPQQKPGYPVGFKSADTLRNRAVAALKRVLVAQAKKLLKPETR